MRKRIMAVLLPLLVLLSGCAAQPEDTQPDSPLVKPQAVAPACPEGAQPLSEGSLREWEHLFTLYSPYAQALTSTYAQPETVDLYRMFRGYQSVELTEEEQAALRPKLDDPYQADGGNWHRVSRRELEDTLQRCFGLCLAQTEQRGLDRLLYLPETDSWYDQHSGMTHTSYDLAGGYALPEGDVLLYYYKELEDAYYTVYLTPAEQGWHIVRHMEAGALSDQPGLPAAPLGATALTAEELPEFQALFTADSWYTRALGDLQYSDPRNISLRQLLRRQDPGDHEALTAEELSLLSDQVDEAYLCQTGYRHTRANVEQALRQCFDLRIEDLTYGMGDLPYLEQTDSWYTFAPEGELFVPHIVSGFLLDNGDALLYYYQPAGQDYYGILLRWQNGGWRICAHGPGGAM